MALEISVDEHYVGAVLSDLNRRRGKFPPLDHSFITRFRSHHLISFLYHFISFISIAPFHLPLTLHSSATHFT